MATVTGYRRPASIEDALVELAAPHAVVLGGGTKLNARRGGEPVVVVDLQALALAGIDGTATTLRLGATTTLAAVAVDRRVPPVVAAAARREAPSTLREMATLGGCVAAGDWSSELLAALLAHDAVVSLAGSAGGATVALGALLAEPSLVVGRIITGLSIETGGRAAAARVGRTPADRPIVAAVARRRPDGELRLALCGVASTPILSDGVTPLDPPADFRGSSEYRQSLAATLSRRVREAIA